MRKIYPMFAVGYPDRAQDEQSTYLHPITCYLQMLADRELPGREPTTAVMNFWSVDHYRWVYRTVIQDESKDESKIDSVLSERHLKLG